MVSDPTQTITVTIIVESGVTPVERRLSCAAATYHLTGTHGELMAGFKQHTTPGILATLALSAERLKDATGRAADGAGQELAASA